MLCKGIIAVCAEIHTKLINTLCGQNVELLSVKAGGTYINHWALKCQYSSNSAAFRYMLFVPKWRSGEPWDLS
jgi:hypothetical protein